MSKYLLEAPDDEMTGWRAQADAAGLSFAEWLRRRIRTGTGTAAAPLAAAPLGATVGDLAGPPRPDPRPSSKK